HRARRRLAGRAEVALAELVRMKADIDGRSAFVARQAAPLLYRPELSSIEREARSPRAAVAISPKEVARGEDDAPQPRVIEIGDLRPRPVTRDEQRFVLDLVADP